ncbi:PLP-dependent aminotransferase family protein [Jiella sonneratiae]|uniref:PLP-dependent aminotransferase family protein n=1 Tax=Jiella sonneratiae TaxID=2816856 RepID=A0ABS3J1W0_9HYPH|nr:PLP-dependent aminotransferase family protein [Jiella sonneratiae]MBO0902546.1 PLP-dependent aminotransferase family protein [Jiella sonneratiae]
MTTRSSRMPNHALLRPLDPGRPLQRQIQERIVEAILSGAIVSHEPLPATRVMARQLSVSRNTVTLVYEKMAEDGYLTAVERRGYFVDERFLRLSAETRRAAMGPFNPDRPADARPSGWARHMRLRPSHQPNIRKPTDWQRFPYPFVYGQVAADPVSLTKWRDCIHQAGRAEHLKSLMTDLVDADDPLLIEQIIRRILPRRGIRAGADEILVTIGSQNAVYLVSRLFCGPGTRVAFENPGYVDARNIFELDGAEIVDLPVDASGARPNQRLDDCDLVYVTPSHQAPTNVTMTMQRRLALLQAAERHDLLIVEDDYEHELNHVGPRQHALRGYDRSGRVLHAGSLSKPVFPGLRLGFIVAAPEVIVELRALRRLMYRHPSALDQRAMALFMSEGHYDAHIRRQQDMLARRWTTMLGEIERQLPDCEATMTTGGSALWLRLPEGIAAGAFQAEAARHGAVVEVGDIHFRQPRPEHNFLRLGFGPIDNARIPAGIAALRQALDACLAARNRAPPRPEEPRVEERDAGAQ